MDNPLTQNGEYWANRKLDDPKKDWNDNFGDWIEGYVASRSHPHRKLILKALESFPNFERLLEVGCNAGPNLDLISEHYPDAWLCGIDVNLNAIERAGERLPVEVQLGDVCNIPYQDKVFDVVLADAVLMYIAPKDISKAISELVRVSTRGIIIVDWYDPNPIGVIKDFHWARNYQKLLELRGLKVVKRKITKLQWPTEKWWTNGMIFIASYPPA